MQSRSRAFVRRSVGDLDKDLFGLIKTMAKKGHVVTFDCNASIWWTPRYLALQKLKSVVCVDYSCDFQTGEKPGSIFKRGTNFFPCPRPSTKGKEALLDVAGAIILAPDGKLTYKQTGLLSMVHSVPKVLKVVLAGGKNVTRTIMFSRSPGQCAPTEVTVTGLASNAFTETFSKIYDTQQWGAGEGGGGGSGSGSNLHQTSIIRAQLPPLLLKYGIKSMIDSSCGSLHWMPLVLEEMRKSTPDFRCAPASLGLHGTTAPSARFDAACLDLASRPVCLHQVAYLQCQLCAHLHLPLTVLIFGIMHSNVPPPPQ